MREFAVLLQRTLPFVTVLTLAVAQAWPAAAAGMVLLYEIHSGGFSLGTNEVAISLDGNRYRIRNSLQTRGVIGFFTGFVSESETVGSINGTNLVPESHRADNLWRGNKRWVRASYHIGAAPMVEVMPTAIEDGRESVASAQTVGTVDPLTAGLALTLAAKETQPKGTVAVFDGRRRYDLAVASVAPAQVNEPVYQGAAVRMDIRRRRLAGFAEGGFFSAPKTSDYGYVWFAPPRPETLDLPLPVRLEVDSPLGATVIRLTSVRSTG